MVDSLCDSKGRNEDLAQDVKKITFYYLFLPTWMFSVVALYWLVTPGTISNYCRSNSAWIEFFYQKAMTWFYSNYIY